MDGGILWLPLALLSYFMLGFTGAADRMIVHKEVNKPVVISFWVAVFSVATMGILLIGWLPLPFADQFRFEAPPNIQTLLSVIIAGVMSQAGLLFMYRALYRGEVTRVTSIVGALSPIVALVASYFFLDERLNAISFGAILLLIAGTVVLTIQPGKKMGASSAWVVDAAMAATILALQSVLMKSVFENYQFISAYALTGFGALLYMGILAGLSADVRAALAPKPRKKTKKQKQAKSQVILIIGNAALGGLAVIILNLALKLGSATYVNALRGVQYAVVFIIVVALSHRFPKLLDEDLNRRVIMLKVSGIVLVANGVVLLAIQ